MELKNRTTLALTLLRELTLTSPPQEGRAHHISAASGLVLSGDHFYVVADDENHIGAFSKSDPRANGQIIRVLEGDLPDSKKKRKAVKADFEALVALPAFGNFNSGALLALGSGSRENRTLGVLLPLDQQANVSNKLKPVTVDFTGLFDVLKTEFGEVNIEGAFIDGEYLALLQRGNTGSGRNARVRLELKAFLENIVRDDSWIFKSETDLVFNDAPSITVKDFQLGNIVNIPFGFTDGATLPDGGFVFAAAAEDTDDSYADGECAGAAVGIVDAQGSVTKIWQLDRAIKPEGIAINVSEQGLNIWLVTDPDDAKVAAQMYRLET
jgi:hypothetical protein